MRNISQWIRSEVRKAIREASKTGVLTGSQENQLSRGLRAINKKHEWERRPDYSKINLGGCGIFAKLLYYHIKKLTGLEPVIWIISTTVDGYPKTDPKQFASMEEWPAHVLHVVLQLGDYYLDSTGVHTLPTIAGKYGRAANIRVKLDIKTLSKWVATSDGWNDTFDRYTTGDINKDLEELMSKLKTLDLFKGPDNAVDRINQYIKGGNSGTLDLTGMDISKLPLNLKVIDGDLILDKTNIDSLPPGLDVKGKLSIVGTKVQSIPQKLKADTMHIWDTPLASKHPDEREVQYIVAAMGGNVNSVKTKPQ